MKRNHIFQAMALGLFLSSCNSDQPSTPAEESTRQNAVPVIVTHLQPVKGAGEISISGNIEGNKTVRLGFMVAGKINHIAAAEGQPISKGQLVASLDPASYQIAKELADIQVNATADEFNRLKIMHERNSLSDGDFSKVNFGLQQAKAQQKLQEKNLADTRLYAPISGVLLKKLGETGEITGVGTPLFVISDISTVKVNAYIPEGELHRIRLGQPAQVTVSALNETFTGKVVEVGSAADITSRAFTVKIELPNPKRLIRPGMIAEVRLQADQETEILALPAEAVLHGLDNQSYVYVADTAQQKVFKRNISVGALTDNKITITSGLNPGEAVVIAGQNKLTDGVSVSIQK